MKDKGFITWMRHIIYLTGAIDVRLFASWKLLVRNVVLVRSYYNSNEKHEINSLLTPPIFEKYF